LAQLIEEGSYCAHQVFNVDETGLFWKKIPARTFTAKEEKTYQGYIPAKNRLTLLLADNAAGDFKLKPHFVYHSKNPRAVKGKFKTLLPVILRSNYKAWVTGTIFQDWFCSDFVPAVKAYLLKNNLIFKYLLLDNAPGHPQCIGDPFPEIKMVFLVFLPPNTTSLL
jgi:hypothetical protein